jgi:transglutaminase-like putative cysteine protease
MQYAIHHITHFEYEAPISEGIMEVRGCPRTDALQQCYSFELSSTPHAQLFSYQDFMGNMVHHFDIPSPHDELKLESRALVEVRDPPTIPQSLPAAAWDELDRLYDQGEHLEMTMPSAFARPEPLLEELREECGMIRRDDPLSLLRELNASLYRCFEYSPRSTHARSPISDALKLRSGVCQDFAHIFIAIVRELRIPCRYVSGYLFHRAATNGTGDRSAADGSHAWAEAFLPELGWLGFDPTNNILAEDRHVRVALGRDYADVPPTRGVFKGNARSRLHVGVSVAEAKFAVRQELVPEMAVVTQGEGEDATDIDEAIRLRQAHQRQMQQQQQQ